MNVIGVEKTRKLKHLSKYVMEIEREDVSVKADKTHKLCKRKSNVFTTKYWSVNHKTGEVEA